MEPMQTNKKTLIIVTILSVLLVVIIIISLFVQKATEYKPVSISPTPTKSLPTPSLFPTEKPVAFPTVFIPLTGTPDEYISIQAQADKEWAKDYKDAHIKYPWIDNFPIKTDTYFVYFSSDINKFIAKIYDKNLAESIKAEITQKLQSMNIDLNTYPIEWQIRGE